MAAAKRYNVEQVVAKLREHEKLQGQGLTIPQACKRIGISDQTFYRWRLKYGALKEDEAQRLKALEQENGRLKRIVAELTLEMFPSGSMVCPIDFGTTYTFAFSTISSHSWTAVLSVLGCQSVKLSDGRVLRASARDKALRRPGCSFRPYA
jgi:hypothetical protein